MTRNPYPGLRSFEPVDSDLFFGRETETDDLRRRLRNTRFLAVVGASGSGKSSLVRCGLIPSLHAGLMSGAGDAWRVALIRPGDDPIGRLAIALDQPGVLRAADASAPSRYAQLEAGLRDSSLGLAETVRQAQLPVGTRLLLVVDQFEELFRYRRVALQRSGHSDATAFVRLLIEAARHASAPVYIVITMRAEFIGECMAFDGLAEVINAGQYLIPRMSRDAMRLAISGPAAVRGATIAPRLLVRLLNEIGDDLDRLPVLQHALMRTWQAWEQDHTENEPLDLRHYEAIGTTREALSRHAEEAWRDVTTPAAQTVAERLWKALTETSESGHQTRRPTALAALIAICEAPPEQVRQVIEVFRQPERGFLQPPAGNELAPDTVIDITHESLMRLWPRLGEWIRDEARSTEIYRRLLRAARQHEAGEASLWRAPELGLGLKWFDTQQPNVAWAGNADDFALATSYLQRSRRAQTGRTAIASACVAALVGSLAYLAYSQAELAQARQQAVNAQKQTVLALTDQLQKLRDARQVADQERLRTTPELLRLRAQHESLSTATATLRNRQDTLEAAITRSQAEALRFRLTIEKVNQSAILKTEHSRDLRSWLQQDLQQINLLSYYKKSFDTMPVPMSVVAQIFGKENENKKTALHRLNSILTNITSCQDEVPTAGSGWNGSAPPRIEKTPPLAEIPAHPPQAEFAAGASQENIQQINDEIQATSKKLADLQEKNAKAQGEIKFLTDAVALLKQQAIKLNQAVIHLARLRSELEEQKKSLLTRLKAEQDDESAAEEQLKGIRQTALDNSKKLTKITDEFHDSAQSVLVEIVSSVNEARNYPVTEYLIKKNSTTINESAIQPLLNSKLPNPEVNALFAVQAFRWSPYDVDSAQQPMIYNGLWQALAAIDARAAHRFVDPSDTPAGEKIATRKSADLVKALCARVNRPLTEAEWAQRFARDAQGRWTSVCYPKKPNPCVP